MPFLRAHGAQVWGSGHFSISSLDSVLSTGENGAHHLLGPLLMVNRLGEQLAPCCIDRVGSRHIVYSEDKCF